MSADGNWKITLSTPMGPQEMNASITTQGSTFTGKIDSPMGAQDINGAVNGDTLTWKADITKPMPLTLEFEAKVDGDKMTGSAKLGAFGSAPLNGTRV
jgi:hypothetical protein